MSRINKVKLGNRIISKDSKPYVIAEIGVNHEGSMDKALMLISMAAESGADAVKFQSYKAETLAIIDSPAYWDAKKEKTKSQYELFKKYDCFEPEDFVKLSKYCQNLGIEFLSTPFDDFSIEFLDPLMRFYKIASADITNLPFLRKVAIKGKPIVLSTGASTLEEINKALDVLFEFGSKDVVLLHCILNYPTEDKNAHLSMISGMKQAYPELLIGYSDHTMPDSSMTSLLTAYLLGAVVIEKHFTFDKNLPGNDHYHAMDGNDLARLISLIDKVDLLKGPSEIKTPIPTEDLSIKNARRSIVLSNDLNVNHIICEEDITYKRPGTGISPEYWDLVIGRKVVHNLKADDLLQWEDLQSIE